MMPNSLAIGARLVAAAASLAVIYAVGFYAAAIIGGIAS